MDVNINDKNGETFNAYCKEEIETLRRVIVLTKEVNVATGKSIQIAKMRTCST